ncbi:Peroxisomal targeting signal 1 receptor encoded by the pex5 protein [Pleurostoma richardsiae]|uniref:Peroxisomal targeting signal receptor n=1 Tax=Pleurostoma richardsiae TaxID=41990 RepID=A0AA38R8C2_9PEZI|nr:Peroxisomal targeting signal 1 receptor encoded by the pex5 protein [Pleurostoma richardsiae]
MSFLAGAECSTAGNPLSQFSKHVQDDKSLQRDKFLSRGSNGSTSINTFRGAGRSTPQDEVMNNFLHQSPGMPETALDQGLRASRPPIDFSHGVHLRAQTMSPSWDAQPSMEPLFQARMAPGFSSDEFVKFQAAQSSTSRSTPGVTNAQVANPNQRPVLGMGRLGSHPGYGMMGGPLPMYHGQSFHDQPQHVQHAERHADAKGKGKVVELDEQNWEQEFAQIELQDQQAQHDENLAMEDGLNKMDENVMESETGFGDFESIWRGIQEQEQSMRTATGDSPELRPWADDFDTWAPGSSRMGADPPIEEYLFEEENIFKDQPNPFDEGVRIMAEGGNLSLAALAFEAAVQKDPRHVEAWVYLGSAQAQNEKEEAALRALEHALKLDPNNLTALMGLAVSYINEGYDSTAYRTLERWLSAKYPQIIAPSDLSAAAELGFTDRAQLHEKVTSVFIKAAQLSPDGEHMDPDVQVGLGVLFYGAEDYDKAVDCFSAALASSELGASNQRSQIHLLWNRLGATLANSGRSEEAIAAYEKALALNPNFVRARYNLGVSCMNIGCHAEAAGHLLSALEMHKSVEKSGRERAREILSSTGDGHVSDEHLNRMTTQNRSTTLYDTLRRVFTLMGRRDLSEKVVVGMDPNSFRSEFEF